MPNPALLADASRGTNLRWPGLGALIGARRSLRGRPGIVDHGRTGYRCADHADMVTAQDRVLDSIGTPADGGRPPILEVMGVRTRGSGSGLASIRPPPWGWAPAGRSS